MSNDFDDVFRPRKVEPTARFTLSSIPKIYSDKHAVLIGRHAGRTNKAYMNALMKIIRAEQSQSGGVSVAKLESNDAQARKLLAQHVIVGWENVNSRDGKPIACSADKVLAFFEKLAEPDQYPELVASNGPIERYFSDGENFRGAADEPVADGSALGEG